MKQRIKRNWFIALLGFMVLLLGYSFIAFMLKISILVTGILFLVASFVMGDADEPVHWDRMLIINIANIVFMVFAIVYDPTKILIPLVGITFSVIGFTLRSEWWAMSDLRLSFLVFSITVVTLVTSFVVLPNWLFERNIKFEKLNMNGVKMILHDHDTIQPKAFEHKVIVLAYINPKSASSNKTLVAIKTIRHMLGYRNDVVYIKASNDTTLKPATVYPMLTVLDQDFSLKKALKIKTVPSVVIINKTQTGMQIHNGYSIDENLSLHLKEAIVSQTNKD